MKKKYSPLSQINLSFFFLFAGWWIGWDTFFSIYTDSIVGNITLVGAMTALYALLKAFFTIPVWYLDTYLPNVTLIRRWKILYIFTALFYSAAGIFQSIRLFIIAMILNGLANPLVVTSYQNLIRLHSTPSQQSWIFWAFWTAGFLGHAIGALLASILILYLDISRLFIWIMIGSLIGLLIDNKIEEPKSTNHSNKFLITKISEFSLNFLKSFHKLSPQTYKIFFLVSVYGMLNYISYLFIPLLTKSYDFSLSLIALLFVAIRLPHSSSYFLSVRSDHSNPKKVLLICILLVIMWFLPLTITHNFFVIIVSSLISSIWIAGIYPIAAGLLTSLVKTNQSGITTGLQEFFVRIGEIIGALTFMIWSIFLSLSHIFFALCILLVIIAIIISKENKQST